MNKVVAMLAVLVMSNVVVAQQSPPADGVGLGNDHLTFNSNVSSVPSMSANVNAEMTNTVGSASGGGGIPAFAGSSSQTTSTFIKSQGVVGANPETAATASRRGFQDRSAASQSTRTVTNPAGSAVALPVRGTGAGTEAKDQQGQRQSKNRVAAPGSAE